MDSSLLDQSLSLPPSVRLSFRLSVSVFVYRQQSDAITNQLQRLGHDPTKYRLMLYTRREWAETAVDRRLFGSVADVPQTQTNYRR